MSAPTYRVVLTWVERGKRVSEGWTAIAYEGPYQPEGADIIDRAIEWARSARGAAGAFFAEMWLEDKLTCSRVWTLREVDTPEGPRNPIGYPPHVCGAPLVWLGARLFCPRCDVLIAGTSEQREKAARAWQAEGGDLDRMPEPPR